MTSQISHVEVHKFRHLSQGQTFQQLHQHHYQTFWFVYVFLVHLQSAVYPTVLWNQYYFIICLVSMYIIGEAYCWYQVCNNCGVYPPFSITLDQGDQLLPNWKTTSTFNYSNLPHSFDHLSYEGLLIRWELIYASIKPRTFDYSTNWANRPLLLFVMQTLKN